MGDQDLLTDIPAIPWLEKHSALLRQHAVTTYSDLYRVLRDPASDAQVRVAACWVIIGLSRWRGRRHIGIDRRRAIPPLLEAFKAQDKAVRQAAIQGLGLLYARRAFQPLLALVADKNEDVDLRVTALNVCGQLHEERALPVLRQIIFDEAEPLRVRSEAIEWSAELRLSEYIELLRHPSADVRFWACFRIPTPDDDAESAAAFEILDHVVAQDHTLPEYWGWHVDREALRALEVLRYRAYRQSYVDEDGELDEYAWNTWIISPQAEYDDYLAQYRVWQDDWRYATSPMPPATFQVSPAWLKAQLEAAWEGISFALQRSTKQAYILEWAMQIAGRNLIGGLHRDGYSVVVTGSDESVLAFAAWYVSLFEDAALRLYAWADIGVPLTLAMTPDDIARTIKRMEAATRQPPPKAQSRS